MTTPATALHGSRNPLRIALLGLVALVAFAAFSPAAAARDPLGVPHDNQAPSVEITSPENLSSHVAVLDARTRRFGAVVFFSASVSDPNRDRVTVRWFSSDDGYLGSGEQIVAILYTGQSDSAQPRITARATDRWGATTETSVQVSPWICSDNSTPPGHRPPDSECWVPPGHRLPRPWAQRWFWSLNDGSSARGPR
jgi:hypothetical protein